MVDPEGAQERSSTPHGAVIRAPGPEHRRMPAGPPPRPEVTTRLPPPGSPPVPERPGALRLSAACWFLAATAGGVGVLAALGDRDALRRKLTGEATEADPGLAADAIADGVALTTALVLGSVAVLSVVLVVWTAVLLRRRPWARWLLLATGVLALAADDVAQTMVSGGAEVDRIALVVQAVLVVVALVSLFLPSTGRWLRLRRD